MQTYTITEWLWPVRIFFFEGRRDDGSLRRLRRWELANVPCGVELITC